MNNYIELFAGIGGMSHGLTKAGWNCAGYVEMDKYAHQSFEILHDPEKKLWSGYDVRDVSDGSIRELGERTGGVRLLTGGFPCQSFSIAGKRAGFTDLTRGTLFFEIVRFASILRPKNLLLENVTGLLSHDSGGTFETILGALDEMGYDVEWQVHNSSAYVPQNRERIFIVASLGGRSTRKVFPFGRENNEAIDVIGRIEGKGDDYVRRVYGVGGLSPALPTMQGGGQEPKVLVVGHLECDSGGTGKAYDPEGVAPTQLAQHGNAVTKVIVAGNVNPSGNGMNGQVFNADGLAPTLTTNKGEGNKILVNEKQGIMYSQKDIKLVDIAGTLLASGPSKGRGNYNFVPGVLEISDIARTVRASGRGSYDGKHTHNLVAVEPRAVLTPDRPEKHQNGRRMKEPGEPMFTLTAQDKHGVAISIDMKAEKSTTRRGTFKEEYTGALDRDCNVAVTQKYRIHKLTVLECFRLQSYPDIWYVTLKLFRHPDYIPMIDMNRNDITHQVTTIIKENGLKEGMSDSQLYKMAGNGVTSDVAEDIGWRLLL